MKRSLILAMLMSFALFLTGCGNGGTANIQIPGVAGPTVKLEAQNIVIDVVFEKIMMEGGLHYAIPQLEDSFVDLSADPTTGGTHMAFTVSIAGLLKGYGAGVDPLKLPGGRLLPGVASGALPAVAFTVEKFQNVTFYIGKDVFGFFVPCDVGFDANIASFRYYIGDKRGGNISMVGRDVDGANSGILLLLDMNNQVKGKLQNYLARGNF